ncbi:MAG: phosphohistidine phosphatase SixA [Colwellia sp.]|nr:phosphohistidine phosphatase SixA [Colwellia sp.]
MQLFIMRHGEAIMSAPSDAQRPLSVQGKVEAYLMGKWLHGLDVDIEQVLVSPYLRAQQTSTCLLSELDCQPNIQTLDIITPSGSATDVHDYIDGLCSTKQYQNLLMVTHMPLVSYLVADLTFDNQSPIFQTAAIAEINYDLKLMKGQLVRLISPLDLC